MQIILSCNCFFVSFYSGKLLIGNVRQKLNSLKTLLFTRLYNLLSRNQQKQSVWIAATVLLRSLLDFIGLAALVPVIFLIAERLGNDHRLILLLCGAVMIFVALKNGAVYWLARRQIKFQMGIYREFSRRMYVNYYRRGLLFLKKKSSVQLAYEVNGIAMIFSQSVMGSLFGITGDVILLLLISLALIIWKPVMGALIFAIFVPVAVAYAAVVRKRVKRLGDASIQAQRAQTRTVTETFRGYPELEIAGAFDASLSNFERNMDTIIHNRLMIDIYRLMPSFLSEIAFVAGLMILVAFGGDEPLFTGGVFAMAAFHIIPSVRSMLNNWASLQNNSFAIEVVENGLKEDDIPVSGGDAVPMLFNKGMEVRDIGFSFPDGNQLFRNLSFSLRPGQRVGIRGKSGSGKSTLFNIMLGFFSPTEGEIFIDGQKLSPSTRDAWHKTVGYVPQEIFIIDGSLAENIALGSREIDMEKVNRVLHQVQLDEWAASLSYGLDTNLGEYGSRISGGQKQRIGIARALYKGAKVLFFDEATSSLDSATEREINDALKELSENHRELTLVIIAHRESSLEFCDRIISL